LKNDDLVTELKNNIFSLAYIGNSQGRLKSIIGSGQNSALGPLPTPPLTGIKNANSR